MNANRNNKFDVDSENARQKENERKEKELFAAVLKADDELVEVQNKLTTLVQELSPDVSEKVPTLKVLVDELNKSIKERDAKLEKVLKLLQEEAATAERTVVQMFEAMHDQM